MDKRNVTENIKAPNKDLEALRIYFPHCFDKDGNFQLEKFKNNLSEKEINFSTEDFENKGLCEISKNVKTYNNKRKATLTL